jgi:hypothetical protein
VERRGERHLRALVEVANSGSASHGIEGPLRASSKPWSALAGGDPLDKSTRSPLLDRPYRPTALDQEEAATGEILFGPLPPGRGPVWAVYAPGDGEWGCLAWDVGR